MEDAQATVGVLVHPPRRLDVVVTMAVGRDHTEEEDKVRPNELSQFDVVVACEDGDPNRVSFADLADGATCGIDRTVLRGHWIDVVRRSLGKIM